jgi:hypothetical protein
MSDPLEPVAPGDPPPLRADTFNLVFEAARAYRNRRQGAGGAAALEHDPVTGNVLVWVRNDAGSTKAAFSVLQLGQPVIDVTDATGEPHKFRHNPVFPGTAPTGPDVAFAVTIEPLASGGIGRAVLLGVCVCDLSVTDAAHAYAAPAAGTTATLASDTSGPAKIVWKAAGTGTKRAVVVLNAQDQERGAWLAELTTSSGGLWKWYHVVNDAATGPESATYNAKPAKVDGANLLNPVAGLRVWMYAGGGATPYDFLPVGYAASTFGGLLSATTQTITGDKTLENHLSVNSTQIPTATVPPGTGEAVPLKVSTARLNGTAAVTALQTVDSYTGGALAERAVYAFRELWNLSLSESVPHSIYCGGAVFAKGNASAFLTPAFDVSNTFPVFTGSGGLVAATLHAYPDSAEYVQWNVIPYSFLGLTTTGYTALGKTGVLTHFLAGGGDPASDSYQSLVFGQKGKHDGTGVAPIYLVIDGTTNTRVATTQGYAIVTPAGNLVDGLDSGCFQGGILTGAIPSGPAALTDSTGGTANSTLQAVGDTSASDQGGTINDNFADLAAKVNAIRTALLTFGAMT